MTMMKVPGSSGLPEVKGPDMNDRDRLNDILASEKYLTMGYNIATFEASSPRLRQDLQHILQQTHAAQREVFELMFRKGWYAIPVAEIQQMQKAHQDFSGYLQNQIPPETPARMQ